MDTPNKNSQTVDERKAETLKLEYQMCHQGYVSRDETLPSQIIGILVLFSALAALLGVLSSNLAEDQAWRVGVSSILFAAGWVWLLAMHMDIAANLSCKIALRKRMVEIENYLVDPSSEKEGPSILGFYKDTIGNRVRHREEFMRGEWQGKKKYFKFFSVQGGLYIWVGRLGLVIWPAMLLIVIFVK